MLGRDTIKLGAALDLMRKSKVPFSLRFVSCDRERGKVSQLKFIHRAQQSRSAKVNWDSDTIDVKNLDNNKFLRVHKFLITDFNDKRVLL